MEFAVTKYPRSISPETATALIALADATGAAHPGQRYPAEGIRAALAPAVTP